MKKGNLKVNIILLSILIFLIVICSLNKIYPILLFEGNLIFWVILAVITFLMCGFPRIKHYLNKITIRYIVIALLGYLLVIYLLGIFTGFTRTVFSLELINIIKNILPVILLVISKEIIRYILVKHSTNSKQLIAITIVYIIFDLVTKNIGNSFTTIPQVFTFIFLNCLPTIAREALCTYITSKVSLIPTIVYVLAFEIAIYILPIYPNLGNYLNSVIGLVFPFLVYGNISKFVKYNQKQYLNLKKHYFILFLIPLVIFVTIVIILISGIFSYKMIAIGSDSMNPVYYRGDAVIYKEKKINEIKEEDILVFNYNGAIITHRVVNIITKDDKIYFQTKGDNNNDVDPTLVDSSNVYGVVNYIVKYIGYPTLWIQELV